MKFHFFSVSLFVVLLSNFSLYSMESSGRSARRPHIIKYNKSKKANPSTYEELRNICNICTEIIQTYDLTNHSHKQSRTKWLNRQKQWLEKLRLLIQQKKANSKEVVTQTTSHHSDNPFESLTQNNSKQSTSCSIS